MLSKLLKHEFRATGRTMLPVYAAVVVLAVLANFSIRVIDKSVHTLLTIFCGLIIAAFIIGIIAAGIMTLVMMIKRFYTNYLKDEGYLMHTLPVSVHELVWSKMIVSVVWFAATAAVICLVILLTALIQTGTSLAQFFAGFPSWAEIKAALAEAGIRSGDLWLFGLEMLLAIIVAGLYTCLHFYAAMSLGHMFAKDKILLSIVFFVGISFVLSLATTGYGSARFYALEASDATLETVKEALRLGQAIMGEALLVELVQSAVLYVATVLGLKRGLNLA
jgi:hypothetical protein